MFQSSCYSSLSIVVCLAQKIKLRLDDMIDKEDHTLSDISSSVLHRLRNKLFERLEIEEVHLVSLLLDPLFKNVEWVKEYIEKNGVDEQILLKKYIDVFKIKPNNNNDENTVPNVSLNHARMELFNELCSGPNNKTIINTRDLVDQEIQSYLRVIIKNVPLSPWIWWQENEMEFPRLKQLFEAFLSASPTSASSEMSFSKAGKFLRPDRSNLNGFKLNMICFVNSNIQFMEENRDVFLTTTHI